MSCNMVIKSDVPGDPVYNRGRIYCAVNVSTKSKINHEYNHQIKEWKLLGAMNFADCTLQSIQR